MKSNIIGTNTMDTGRFWSSGLKVSGHNYYESVQRQAKKELIKCPENDRYKATETEEVKIQLSKRTLNCQQVEDWSIEELQDYLLSFTPTEDETLWLRNNNDYNVCDTEEDSMPFFKTIIK